MIADKLTELLSLLDSFLQEKGWKVFDRKDIEHGCQVTVTDGTSRLPINLYKTGKILVQGKPGELKTALTEWANLTQSGVSHQPVENTTPIPSRQNRIAKYLVIPDNLEKIREVILSLPCEIIQKDTGGPAELYRFDIKQSGQRVTITQYSSGTLMVQGVSGALFDKVCDALDPYLTQSFADRATRYVAGEQERATALSYLEHPEAENEATRWLLEQLEQPVLDFLYENDRRTLFSAAGVRNAFQNSTHSLPDYSVVVMPFAKSFEGFVIRLAVYLKLTTEDALKQKASEIEIGSWIEAIKNGLSDMKRYRDIYAGLDAAWQCRNKALHSDFVHPLSTLKSFAEAEHEVATILRAMSRAYRIFVEENVSLTNVAQRAEEKNTSQPKTEAEARFENVDREALRVQMEVNGYSVKILPEGRDNLWYLIDKPKLTVVAPRMEDGLVIIKGNDAELFIEKFRPLLTNIPAKPESSKSLTHIGVDESGKGDLFGPLVVAAVHVNSETEVNLARRGVKDSKAISDSNILELAKLIRATCPVETLILLPPEYNTAYEEHGRNLNRLLAWGHAQVITRLHKQYPSDKAISDQFGDEKLLIEALRSENCQIQLEQRPRAESDIAVAAASIIARAEFVKSMEDYTLKSGLQIPLGASASQVKEIGKQIYRRWGKPGLERIAKMHFKTVQEITSEVDR